MNGAVRAHVFVGVQYYLLQTPLQFEFKGVKPNIERGRINAERWALKHLDVVARRIGA